MVYSLLYRRPALAESSASTLTNQKSSSDGSVRSGSTGSTPYGIPEALSFERVINGGTCPPCTTRDFMNYLLYIERAAENLQFYLWFRGYIKRFQDLPASEKALSPPWLPERSDATLLGQRGPRARPAQTGKATEIFKGTDFDPLALSEKAPVTEVNPFEDDWSSAKMRDDETATLQSSIRTDVKKSAAQAFEAADVKLQPFTVQPYREEITRIIATYVATDSPRQLNLASRERIELLQALAQTTHPSAFHDVLKTVEWSLRHQAHRNFVRWTICNGNRPRVFFARGLGIGTIVIGLAAVIILTLSSAPRAWRAVAMIPLVIGIATLFAAWKGMCVVLHGMHHRHLRPWELFVDADQVESSYDMNVRSMDSFGSANSYEDSPWVAKYEKRNVVRKVFDREVWVQEPALRQIQDTIFVQAILSAFLSSAIVVAVFLAVPQINKF